MENKSIINKNLCNKNTQKCHFPYSKNPRDPIYECCKSHLFELLSYIISVFELYNIEYFLDYGSLLGCVRNNSFIPWDDDIDIAVIDNGDNSELIEKAMIHILNNDKNYHCMKNDNPSLISYWYRLLYSIYNTLHIDICVKKINKDNNYLDHFCDRHNWSINKTELFPLKTVKFNQILVKIPNKSKTYLKRLYGENCIDEIQTRGNKYDWEEY
jgi:phosphorylcholine metabolism protein LicD